MLITHPDLYFTLDGTPSHTPAWRITNTLELIKPAHLRGTKPRVLPGAAGGRPLPLRVDVTERVLNGRVYGLFDPNGGRHSTEIEGLDANLRALATAWATPPGTADSTRTCVLHRFGATATGPVQVLDMDWDYAEMPIAANVVIRLLLPAGALA